MCSCGVKNVNFLNFRVHMSAGKIELCAEIGGRMSMCAVLLLVMGVWLISAHGLSSSL